jgi:FkbM family methyltransferase
MPGQPHHLPTPLRVLFEGLAWRAAKRLPLARRALAERRFQARLAWRGWWGPPVRVAGLDIPLGRHIVPTILAAIDRGAYEAPEINTVTRTLERHDVVLELGAGMGVVSAYCARQIGSERVHAYEANPAMERHIRALYARNRVSPRLHMCVLGRDAGAVPFWIAPRSFLGSSLVRQSHHRHSVTVPVRSLNQEIAALQPTFLIVDIEGGEDELMDYADFGPVRKVSMEVHEEAYGAPGLARLARALADRGFRRREDLTTPSVWYLERR